MSKFSYQLIISIIILFSFNSLGTASKWRFKEDSSKDYYITNDQNLILFQNSNSLFIEAWGYANITDIKISPYNNYLAVSTNLGVALYSLTNKKLVKYFITKSEVNSIDFHPDEATLVMGLRNGQAILWNVKDLSYKHFIQELNPIKMIKFSLDGRSIITVTSRRTDSITVRTIDAMVTYNLSHRDKIRDISVTSDSIYIGDESGSVYHINVESRKIKKLLSYNGWVSSLAYTNNLVISGGVNSNIYLYPLLGSNKEIIYFHNSPIKKVITHISSNTLYSADASGVVMMTNLGTKKEKLLLDTKHGIKNMVLSKDGNIIVIVLPNNKLWVVYLSSGVIDLLERHLAAIYSANSTNKKGLIITGHDDGAVVFWVRGKRQTIVRREHFIWVNDIFIMPGVAFSGDGSGRVIEWDLNSFTKIRDIFFNKPILGFSPKSKNNIRVITPKAVYDLNTINQNVKLSRSFDHRIIASKYNKQDKQLALSLSNGDIVILDSNDEILKMIPNKKVAISLKWGLEKDQLYLTYGDGTNDLLSLKKPYKRKAVKRVPSGVLNFDDDKDKSTSLVWAKRGVLLKVKTKDNKIAKVKSIGEKDKRDIIEGLKKVTNNKNLPIGDIAKAHLKLAEIYYSEGEYSKSLYHYKKAIRIYKGLGDKDYLWKIYNNMGVIYYNIKRYKTSLTMFKRSLSLKENHPIVLYNTALAYRSLRNTSKTYLFFNKAFKFAKSSNNMLALGHVAYIFAKYYYRQKKYNLANSYIRVCASAAKAIDHVGLTKKSILLMAKIKNKYKSE